MALLARANELQAAGHDVIHLEIGEPDFTTAAPIVAGQAALAAGHTRYTAARGLPALREAIAGFYGQRYGLSIDPERILITPGGSGALLLASSLLVDPGKHWLLADPGYPCNRHFLRLVEGGAQLVPVGPEVNYQLTADLVERYWDKDWSVRWSLHRLTRPAQVGARGAGQPCQSHPRAAWSPGGGRSTMASPMAWTHLACWKWTTRRSS